jgi:hypothetical protein
MMSGIFCGLISQYAAKLARVIGEKRLEKLALLMDTARDFAVL